MSFLSYQVVQVRDPVAPSWISMMYHFPVSLAVIMFWAFWTIGGGEGWRGGVCRFLAVCRLLDGEILEFSFLITYLSLANRRLQSKLVSSHSVDSS